MSYILDALKKSEMQRNAGRIPTVAAPHGVLIEQPRTAKWSVVAVVAALAVAAVGVWWLNGKGSVPGAAVDGPRVSSAPASNSPPLDRPAVAAQPAPPANAPASGRVAPDVKDDARPAANAGGEAIPRLKLAVSLPSRNAPSATTPAEFAKTLTKAPANAVAHDADPPRGVAPNVPAKAGVVAYGDLPASVRQSLPPLNVGGFAAGDSGGTMVMIDDRLLREGEEAAPGVRLEKILPDGAEFSYKGYRFRR